MATTDRLVVIGDINGDTGRFLNILTESGLSDSMGNWRGGDAVLIQLGDIINPDFSNQDPGEAFFLLKRLQAQARLDGGWVIRLLGDNELALLQKRTSGLRNIARKNGMDRASSLRQHIRHDILEGSMSASFAWRNTIFLHGEADSNMLKLLLEEVRQTEPEAYYRGELYQLMSAVMNNALVDAVETGHCPNFLFNPRPEGRSVTNRGGIYWRAFSLELADSVIAGKVREVIAHVPLHEDKNRQRSGGDKSFGKYIGGRLSSLEILDNGMMKFIEKRPCYERGDVKVAGLCG